MITNERLYKNSKVQLQRLENALKKPEDEKLPPKVRKAMRKALQGQFDAVKARLTAYENLSGGNVAEIAVNSLAELALALIQARIARTWTQKQLAEKLKLPEQQIQRYESTRYRGAAVERLQEVAAALNVSVQGTVTLNK
jgi:HTH-type transcriptional regulator/antitoxin HigA